MAEKEIGRGKESEQKKDDAVLEELTLLGNMMKLHEWTKFGQGEAEEEACLEANLDSEGRPKEDKSPEDRDKDNCSKEPYPLE